MRTQAALVGAFVLSMIGFSQTAVAQDSGFIPLTDPVVQQLLNDPTSTQAFADLGVIYGDTTGIYVDCNRANQLHNYLGSLLAAAHAAVAAALRAYNDHVEPGADWEISVHLYEIWQNAIAEAEATEELYRDGYELLGDLIEAAGC